MKTIMLNGWLLYTDEPSHVLVAMLGDAIESGCSADLTIMTENSAMDKLVVHGDDQSMALFNKVRKWREDDS